MSIEHLLLAMTAIDVIGWIIVLHERRSRTILDNKFLKLQHDELADNKLYRDHHKEVQNAYNIGKNDGRIEAKHKYSNRIKKKT